jgi:N-carbamoylputrescine amidase
MREVTVAGIQLRLEDDRERNVRRVLDSIREAAAKGAQVILPSELFEGHYFCKEERDEHFLRAHPVDRHPFLGRFCELAKELCVVLPVSFFEKAGPAYYNSVAMIDADGTLLGIYRKSHIPDGPGYEEKFYFRPGDTGFRAWDTRFGRLGVGICWDQWYPEAARVMMLLGAEILLYPTAIGSEPANPSLDTRRRWQRAMIGHAVSNVVPVVASNRIGDEGNQRFYGHSFCANEAGDIVEELPDDREGIVRATFDLAAIARDRASWGFFRDRRPELYRILGTADGSTGVALD